MSRKLINRRLLEEVENKRSFFQIYPCENEQLNLRAEFGNDNPVILEIGSGRGEFLTGQSLLDWDHNYLGIEINAERLKYTLRQLDMMRHKNVRVMNLFVDEKVITVIPEDSIRKIFIIHPDPWPKRRHHPRRLIQHQFLDVLYQILDERGVLEIQTDHREYSDWIMRHLGERKDFEPVNGGITDIPHHGHIVTYFEEKKMREGHRPVYITFRKKRKY